MPSVLDSAAFTLSDSLVLVSESLALSDALSCALSESLFLALVSAVLVLSESLALALVSAALALSEFSALALVSTA